MTETHRVAIVTGGSRGIGRQTVSRLAQDGFAVVVVYAGRTADAEAAVEDVTGTGGRAIAIQADIADEQAMTAVFDRAQFPINDSRLGGLQSQHVNLASHSPLSELELR